MVRIIFFLVSCILFLVSFSPAYATEDIGQSRIYPASPFYFLKTIRENIELKFAATPRVKLIRQLEFATRRLREVKSLVAKGSEDPVAPTLEKYWYHLQSLPDKDLKDKELVTKINESLSIHLQVLQTVYSQLSNPRAKMAIRATINRLVGRADLPRNARLQACIFLTKEASSSALNETEKAVFLERALKCKTY